MPSSKGKPTDPKLREQVKKEVQQMDKGGGKGQWSAWKAGELARQYEAKGGGYEDTGDNPNEAKKGNPSPKKDAVEKGERKSKDAPVGESKKPAAASKGKSGGSAKKAEDKKTKSSSQSSGKKSSSSSARAQPKRANGRKAAAASA